MEIIPKEKKGFGIKIPHHEVEKIIFQSRSSSGCVFGVVHSNNHITLIAEEDSISSHLTDQKQNKPTHIGRICFSDLQKEFESDLIKPKILKGDELNKDVFYFTDKWCAVFKFLEGEFLKQRVTEDEDLAYFDIEALLNSFCSAIPQIRLSPKSYMGFCKAFEILFSKEGELFIIDDGKVVLKIGAAIYEINLTFLLGTISEFVSNLGVKTIEQDFEKRLNEIYLKSTNQH